MPEENIGIKICFTGRKSGSIGIHYDISIFCYGYKMEDLKNNQLWIDVVHGMGYEFGPKHSYSVSNGQRFFSHGTMQVSFTQ